MMSIDGWKKDLETSERLRRLYLMDYYRGIAEHVEVVTDVERQIRGIDIVLTTDDGCEKTVEDKLVLSHHTAILFETWSNSEKRIEGWGYTCEADFLLWSFPDAEWLRKRENWLFDWPMLQEWAIPRLDEFASHQEPYTKNHSISKIIPIDRIQRELPDAILDHFWTAMKGGKPPERRDS